MAIWTAITLPENMQITFTDAQDVVYVLPDESSLPVMVEPVWCRRCSRLVNGEQIETVDVLDRMVGHLREPRSIHYDPVDDADPARELKHRVAVWGKYLRLLNSFRQTTDLERRRRWLLARLSPPRCLQCGSTDVVAFPYAAGMPEMPHPRGHGRLRLDSPCLGDYWGDWPSRLTPEGEAIRVQSRRPKHWWSPRLWFRGWPFRSAGQP